MQQLLAEHIVLTGPADHPVPVQAVIDRQDLRNGLVRLLARTRVAYVPQGWTTDPTSVEDLVLAYMRSGARQAVAA
jgi:hypothetical protein